MSRNTLVVRRGFIVDQRTLGKIRRGHYDTAGPFAVRRTGLVVGGHGRLEVGDGFHGDRRAWNEAEQLGQLRLHLGNVLAVVVDDLL